MFGIGELTTWAWRVNYQCQRANYMDYYDCRWDDHIISNIACQRRCLSATWPDTIYFYVVKVFNINLYSFRSCFLPVLCTFVGIWFLRNAGLHDPAAPYCQLIHTASPPVKYIPKRNPLYNNINTTHLLAWIPSFAVLLVFVMRQLSTKTAVSNSQQQRIFIIIIIVVIA